MTALNRESHLVEYHRVEPHRYIARVRVECTAPDESVTEVSTTYTFIGLSSKGNEEIKAMTVEAYSEKMKRWKHWISEYLRGKVQTEP